jgi:hypothetical protein
MIPRRHAERQRGHGAAQRAQLWLVAPRDSALQSKRGAPLEQVRIVFVIPFSALLHTAGPLPVATK